LIIKERRSPPARLGLKLDLRASLSPERCLAARLAGPLDQEASRLGSA